MKLVSAKEMESTSIRLFESAGASSEEAKIVTEHLIQASLCGVDSHGVMRIPEYLGRLLKIPEYADMYTSTQVQDPIRPGAQIKIETETKTTAVIDGGWGFGQVVTKKAVELAIEKARSSNVGIVAVRNVDQIMRAADYALMAAEKGMIGILFVKTIPVMAAHGGTGRLLGNNPICFAIPAGKENPIVADFAMSVVAGGKVVYAADDGKSIPNGWILDNQGHPSNDPQDFIKGGPLLPAAQHKGYSLALAMEVLAGLLSGAGALADYHGDNAVLVMTLNVEAFMPLEDFKQKIDKLIHDIKSARSQPGVESILVPGELEFRTREKRLHDGIPVPETTMKNIRLLGNRLGVDVNLKIIES